MARGAPMRDHLPALSGGAGGGKRAESADTVGVAAALFELRALLGACAILDDGRLGADRRRRRLDGLARAHAARFLARRGAWAAARRRPGARASSRRGVF